LLSAVTSCAHPAVTAQAPPSPPFQFIGEWGTRGTEPGQMKHPEWISIDFAGNVFVADSGSGFVKKFTGDGRPLLAFDDGVPRSLSCVTVDAGGGIYVLASNVNSLFLYSPEGEMFLRYPVAPQRARQRPQAMAVAATGDIFVIVEYRDSRKKAEANLSEVRQYNFRGRYLRTLTIPAGASSVESAGEFVPAALAAGADGHLYVIDNAAMHVAKFNFDGGYESGWSVAIPLAGSATHEPAGAGIAVTSKYVFAPDPQSHGVRVWTLDGQEKIVDDLGGRLDGIAGQYQIAVSPRGELLVLDPEGVRVLRFRINF
jgi:DNA-binding beta-propeller fold protein YncE